MEKEIIVIDKEAVFDANELFFSITDKESTILSGNDVFVRISGYSKEELVGRYHNIIRHPDMPKIVFKALWDYLNAGKPIVAYVKNRAKDGAYYWVLAAVFPLHDHYISIRLKPGSNIFRIIKELYPQLLLAENKNGMEGSGKLLNASLSDLGYQNYDQFMSDALLKELQSRQKSIVETCLQKKQIDNTSDLKLKLKSVYEYSKMLMEKYDVWFDKMDYFVSVKSLFEEKGIALRQLAREIVILSLNASVSSYQVESGGEVFGVLARDVRLNAKQNDLLIDEISSIVQKLARSLSDVIFAIASMRLKIEMVTNFIEEVLCKDGEVNMAETSSNMCDLIALVVDYSNKSKLLFIDMDQNILDTLAQLEHLERQMMFLGYIQVYGYIEAAGNKDQSLKFGVIFSQLKTFIQQTSQEIETMQKMGKSFHAENLMLIYSSEEIDQLLSRLRNEMAYIKVM